MIVLFVRRSLAYLIDSFLVIILVHPERWAEHIFGELSLYTWFGMQLLAIAITMFYVVGCHARWGCTLGKAICRLRVGLLDGSIPPPVKNAFLRAVPLLVIGVFDLLINTFAPASWKTDIFSRGRWHGNIWETLILFWISLEIIAALLTRCQRSLHDMIGSTMVTRKPQSN